MKRGITSHFAFRAIALLAIAVGIAASHTGSLVAAPPPPAGTIYFKSTSTFWSIRPDGSGST